MLRPRWALDLHVGADKIYAPGRDDTGTRFYTSLKPWKRNKSDMNHFFRFLEFRGLRL